MKPAASMGAKPSRGSGGSHGMGFVEKPKDFKGGMKKLLAYIRPFRFKIILVIILAAASAVFSIFGPRILALITDELVKGIKNMMLGAESGISFSYISKIAFILIGLYGISAIFGYIQGFVMSGVSTKLSYNLRNSIMAKINRLPLGYFHKTSQGDVLSRITNDIDTMEQTFTQSVSQLISSAATFIGVLIMMISISLKLTLVAFVTVPLSMVFAMGIIKISQKHFRGQQEYLGGVNGQVEETYGGHTVIKAFVKEQGAIDDFERDNERLALSSRKAEFLSGMMMPIMSFVGNLGYVGVCIAGARIASRGAVSIGDIQAFIQYVRSFSMPITQLANISSQLQRLAAASERVFEFLDEPEESENAPKVKMRDLSVRGDIEFRHVRFGYSEDVVVINDFSAKVKSGQKVAIVGPTGAGKTTMVKLLMRFHDINAGEILIDGHNICDFTRRDLRTEFGMVLQDAWLYSGSIMENIRYGNPNATDEEVISAAKAAQVHHFVKTLPNGYNMLLDEDTTNVSQGQKQLLTIARAVLADPSVLILDEATSSVDTRTEVLIQRAMDKLMEGRTSFIIAHRLSTIRGADLILCMDKGDIVEQGTHDELMEKNGFYAAIYNSQFA